MLIECQKELKKYRETLQQQYKLQQQHLRLEYQRLILENDRRRQEERKLLMKEIEFRNAMRTDILVMTLSTGEWRSSNKGWPYKSGINLA